MRGPWRLADIADIAELVDIVLTGQHPWLRERCLVDRISSVFRGSEFRSSRTQCKNSTDPAVHMYNEHTEP